MVNEYEIELRIKTGDQARSVTRTEFAYSVMDAVMQASMNQSADLSDPSAQISLVRVGVPTRLVAIASAELAKRVAEAIDRAMAGASR